MTIINKQFIRDFLGNKRFAYADYWKAVNEKEQQRQYDEYVYCNGYMMSPERYEQTIRY